MAAKEGFPDSSPPQSPNNPSNDDDTEALQSKEPQQKVTFASPLHEGAFLLMIVLAQLLTQAGIGQGLAPINYIAQHYQLTDAAAESWFIAGYSLTVGTFILIAGRLGDIFGNKLVFIIGYVWYAVWSLITGGSYYGNEVFFVVCRGLQGVGPSLILPNALALLGRTYNPGMKKNLIFALFAACAPSGFIVGAVFSAIFAEFTWWAWTFWFNGIFCAILAAGAVWAIPKGKYGPPPGPRQKFDFLGAFTGIAGLVLFNTAWNQGPDVGWKDPSVYVLLIIGVLMLIAFVFVERRVESPLVPVKTISGSICFALLTTAMGWASFSIWLWYLWRFLTDLRGHSALLAATMYAPSAVSGLIASICTGILLHKIPVPFVMAVALTAFCAAEILIATMPVDQIYWTATFFAVVIIPFGMDMSFPASSILASNAMPEEHQGTAAGLVVTTVNYAMSLGLGIGGTVEAYLDPERKDVLGEIRHALYIAIGMSGSGIVVILFYFLWEKKKKNAKS